MWGAGIAVSVVQFTAYCSLCNCCSHCSLPLLSTRLPLLPSSSLVREHVVHTSGDDRCGSMNVSAVCTETFLNIQPSLYIFPHWHSYWYFRCRLQMNVMVIVQTNIVIKYLFNNFQLMSTWSLYLLESGDARFLLCWWFSAPVVTCSKWDVCLIGFRPGDWQVIDWSGDWYEFHLFAFEIYCLFAVKHPTIMAFLFFFSITIIIIYLNPRQGNEFSW